MPNRTVILSAFVLMALVQLFVPAKMIFDREDILHNGTLYKFRTAPIDPTDPFRGKYITLNFEDNRVQIWNKDDWYWGEEIYVTLSPDQEGYATIASVSKEMPEGEDQMFVKATAGFISYSEPWTMMIEYPFDRYYMEESKAYDAELAYRDAQVDTSQVAYALVSIKDGESVLKDVLIDGVSIKEIARERKKDPQNDTRD